MGNKGWWPTNSLPEHPTNLLDFQRLFGDEEACLRYLEKLRWPEGFTCERCSAVGEPFRIVSRSRVLKCRSCLCESSITSGTVMHRSKTSVHVWFWAAFLIATQTPGISALELKKRLGIARYETAFQLLHKLRAAMVRPDRDKIGSEWPLEMDVVFVGGKHKGGKRGETRQTPVIIAVEIQRQEKRHPATGKIIERALAGRVRMQKLPNKVAGSIDRFAKQCIAPGAVVVSDDGSEFADLIAYGYAHKPITMRGDREKMDIHLPMVSRVTANLKTWIDGTFHGVRKHHLQAYLDEFTFRFNRRFYRSISFQRLLALGTLRVGPTYREIYAVGISQEKAARA